MQVSDSTTIGAAPAARKDELAGHDHAPHRKPRPKVRFLDALKRGGADPEAAAEVAGAAAAGAVCLRSDPLRVGAPAASTAPIAVAKAAAIDRLLLGTAGGAAEARIRIGGGALAGVEIRLTSVGPQAVTAQLLTPSAGSRQTLSVAMEEIRLRLRERGIALAPSVARGRPGGDARRDGESDPGSRASGGSPLPAGSND